MVSEILYSCNWTSTEKVEFSFFKLLAHVGSTRRRYAVHHIGSRSLCRTTSILYSLLIFIVRKNYALLEIIPSNYLLLSSFFSLNLQLNIIFNRIVLTLHFNIVTILFICCWNPQKMNFSFSTKNQFFLLMKSNKSWYRFVLLDILRSFHLIISTDLSFSLIRNV